MGAIKQTLLDHQNSDGEVILYYSHDKRKITDDNGNDVSVDTAQFLYETGAVDNCNIAFQTLSANSWDMDEVEHYYGSMAQ